MVIAVSGVQHPPVIAGIIGDGVVITALHSLPQRNCGSQINGLHFSRISFILLLNVDI